MSAHRCPVCGSLSPDHRGYDTRPERWVRCGDPFHSAEPAPVAPSADSPADEQIPKYVLCETVAKPMPGDPHGWEPCDIVAEYDHIPPGSTDTPSTDPNRWTASTTAVTADHRRVDFLTGDGVVTWTSLPNEQALSLAAQINRPAPDPDLRSQIEAWLGERPDSARIHLVPHRTDQPLDITAGELRSLLSGPGRQE